MTADDQHVDLVDLLAGELDNAAAAAAGDHLETCETCRAELAQLAVGHAVLVRSGRTLGATRPPPVPPPLTLPRSRPRSRPRRMTMFIAAAATVGVVLGSIATAALTARTTSPAPSPPAPQPSALAAAPLEPVGDENPNAHGEVEMYGAEGGHARMRIRTVGLPSAGAGRFYYAWLLDPSTQKMLPLGQVGPAGGTFDVADSALTSYSAVDISLEDDDGDPAHSVTSVLRGRY